MKDVPLQEHLEKFICLKVSALEKLTAEQFDASEKALHLQAQEYTRRLEALNGEAGRIREILAACTPRETNNLEHEKLKEDMKDLRSFRDNFLGRIAVITILISVGTAILTAVTTALVLKYVIGG